MTYKLLSQIEGEKEEWREREGKRSGIRFFDPLIALSLSTVG